MGAGLDLGADRSECGELASRQESGLSLPSGWVPLGGGAVAGLLSGRDHADDVLRLVERTLLLLLPLFEVLILQQVPRGEPAPLVPAQLLAGGAPQRGDRGQNGAGQAGLHRLADLDLPLPQTPAQPQLLQPVPDLGLGHQLVFVGAGLGCGGRPGEGGLRGGRG